MNSSVQSQPVSVFAMSRRGPAMLAALALLGVVAQAGIVLSRASTAHSDSTAPTVQTVSAMVAEPVYVLANEVDWSKINASPDPSAASVAAYDR